MPLSPEDTLRLNVLLANKPQAIRIHESSMTVFGLTPMGDAEVKLNPNCRDEKYLKEVKELISGHILGSPGGYPVYLQRWTRMGQMRDESLEQLLMLGEPEAVVAAVCANGLTDELARRAWWAMDDAENARRMLGKQAVVDGEMGSVLADYLVEHLPFETEPEKMIDSVRLALQPGLLSDDKRAELWKRAQRKNAYYVGFMASVADDIPEPAKPNPLFARHGETLRELAGDNDLAALLARILSGPGQAYLDTLFKVWKKPGNQEVVNTSLDLLADYFSPARPEGKVDQTLEQLIEEAADWLSDSTDARLGAVLDVSADLAESLRVSRILSGLSYGVVRPVFGGSTAIGSLMRKKLEPVLTPLAAEIRLLQQG